MYRSIHFVLSNYFFQSNLLCEVNRTRLTDMGAEERIHRRQYEEEGCCCVAGLLSGRGRSESIIFGIRWRLELQYPTITISNSWTAGS
jgi:hypothetical protein